MEIDFVDIFSPVGKCPKCGEDLLLETNTWHDINENIEVKCWACHYSERCGLDFFEINLNQNLPDLQTWRVKYPSRLYHDGLLVTGTNLFTTSTTKREHHDEYDETGDDSIKGKIEKITDREEAITGYMEAARQYSGLESISQIDMAYHLASVDHKCCIRDGQSPQLCKENVNFILTDIGPLIGDHFNIYGILLMSWEQLCNRIDANEFEIRNETEFRTKFIEIFKENDLIGYQIEFYQDRPMTIGLKSLEPDMQISESVVVELKTFFKDQKYKPGQAQNLIFEDLEKMNSYSTVFHVGFVLCYSNKFPKEVMMPKKIPQQDFPVRFIIHSVQ